MAADATSSHLNTGSQALSQSAGACLASRCHRGTACPGSQQPCAAALGCTAPRYWRSACVTTPCLTHAQAASSLCHSTGTDLMCERPACVTTPRQTCLSCCMGVSTMLDMAVLRQADARALETSEAERSEAAATLERRLAAMEASLAARRAPREAPAAPAAARGPGAEFRCAAGQDVRCQQQNRGISRAP